MSSSHDRSSYFFIRHASSNLVLDVGSTVPSHESTVFLNTCEPVTYGRDSQLWKIEPASDTELATNGWCWIANKRTGMVLQLTLSENGHGSQVAKGVAIVQAKKCPSTWDSRDQLWRYDVRSRILTPWRDGGKMCVIGRKGLAYPLNHIVTDMPAEQGSHTKSGWEWILDKA